MYAVISKVLPPDGAANLVAPKSSRASLPIGRDKALVDVVVEGHLSTAGALPIVRSQGARLLGELYLDRANRRSQWSMARLSSYWSTEGRERVYAGIDKIGKSQSFVADFADRFVFATSLTEVITNAGQQLNVDLSTSMTS